METKLNSTWLDIPLKTLQYGFWRLAGKSHNEMDKKSQLDLV